MRPISAVLKKRNIVTVIFPHTRPAQPSSVALSHTQHTAHILKADEIFTLIHHITRQHL